MRGSILLFLLVACGGPASSARQIRGPDGATNWIAITCKHAHTLCLERAGEECPGGYDVAMNTGREGQESKGFASSGGFGASAAFKSAPVYDGEMLVKCKGPARDIGQRSRDESEATRRRTCMSSEGCDVGDECHFEHKSAFETGRCQPKELQPYH